MLEQITLYQVITILGLFILLLIPSTISALNQSFRILFPKRKESYLTRFLKWSWKYIIPILIVISIYPVGRYVYEKGYENGKEKGSSEPNTSILNKVDKEGFIKGYNLARIQLKNLMKDGFLKVSPGLRKLPLFKNEDGVIIGYSPIDGYLIIE